MNMPSARMLAPTFSSLAKMLAVKIHNSLRLIFKLRC